MCLIQVPPLLPANGHPGRQQLTGQGLGSLPPTEQTWKEFLAPSFSLVHLALQAWGREGVEEASLSVSLSFLPSFTAVLISSKETSKIFPRYQFPLLPNVFYFMRQMPNTRTRVENLGAEFRLQAPSGSRSRTFAGWSACSTRCVKRGQGRLASAGRMSYSEGNKDGIVFSG